MSVVEDLEKLSALRNSGAISDAEYEKLKGDLLAGKPEQSSTRNMSAAWGDVKLQQKWWFQLLLVLFITPLGLLSLAFNKSYYQKRDGSAARRSILTKILIALLALCLWVFVLFQMSLEEEGTLGLATNSLRCDSAQVKGALEDAINNSVSSNTHNLRLLDIQDIETVNGTGQDSESLRCNARFFLNSGEEFLGYTVEAGTGGMILVSVVDPFATAPPAIEDYAETQSTDEEFSEEELEVEVKEIAFDKRPELSDSDLSVVKSYISNNALFPNRSWTILSSTQIDDGGAVVLLETPEIGVENDCHVCAPPLTLLTFDLSDLAAPSIAKQELDFAEIGTFGQTASVNAITTPDAQPAFAFNYVFSSMGEYEYQCLVYVVSKDEPARSYSLDGEQTSCSVQ